MILENKAFKDSSFGVEEEHAFSLDTSSHTLFDILRNKMYSDKIGAVCREVASNSRDANREAGRADVPIEIELVTPNKLLSASHEKIVFRDNGFGIPPQKIADVFVKYGASTKRADNSQTGGFGLGAKTPFAYNDTFSVVTVCDWVKPIKEEKDGELVVVGYEKEQRYRFTWTANIDSTRKGKMSLMKYEVVDGDTATGTEIIVPIKNANDRWEFEKKVLKYTKTWNKVNYINFNRDTEDKLKLAIEEEDYAVYLSKEYMYNNTELLIDGIPYPLDSYHLENKGRIIDDTNMLTVLKFNTGDLSLVPSREAIQYDKETIAKIDSKIEEVMLSLIDKASNLISEQETYADACEVAYAMQTSNKMFGEVEPLTHVLTTLGNSVKRLRKGDHVWKGRTCVTKFLFKHHKVIEVTLKNGRNNYQETKFVPMNSKYLKSQYLLADTRKDSRRNASIWDENTEIFFLIKPLNEGKEATEELMDFIYNFDIDFGVYSDIERVKSSNSGSSNTPYVKKSYVTLNVRKYMGGTFKRTLEVDRSTYELKDIEKTIVVAVSKRKLANITMDIDTERCSLVSEKYPVYLVKEGDYNKWLSNSPNVKLVEDVAEQIEKELIATHTAEYKKAELARVVYSLISDEWQFEAIKGILPAMYKDVNLSSRYHNLSYSVVSSIKEKLNVDFDLAKRVLTRIFDEKYPMLRSYLKQNNWVHSADKREEHINTIKDYINLINNK